MTKLKLGFLKSSTSFTDKSFLDNTSKSSCGGIPSPKSKRFFTLRRKRNNSSQSQPLLGQENRSVSPPSLRATNPLAEVAASALAITSSISTASSSDQQLAESLDQSPPAGIQTSCETEDHLLHEEADALAITSTISTTSASNKQLAESLDQSPLAGIQTSHETGEQLLHEVTERAATIEDLDSMEEYNQILQESENLGRRKPTQDKLDWKSEINHHDSLPYSRSSIIAAEKANSPPPAPCIARYDQEQIQIQIGDQRYRKVSKFHHILEVLQRAARRVEADQSISQENIFRSLAPLAIFLYIIGIGVLIPRQQRYKYYSRTTEEEEKNTSVARMTLLFFVGMALTLVFLRGMVKLVSVFGRTFCEVDLIEIFRKGECVDVDGRGKGEAELILGGLFM